MKRLAAILIMLASLAGCQESRVADFWNTHDIDYTDVRAAQDQFAAYAEQAVAAPLEEALESMDILFDKLKEDEVAYFLYTGWIDAAFYSLLSPCRDVALYTKAVERKISDGIIYEEECQKDLKKVQWMGYNLKGAKATVPGLIFDGKRTLVLVLDSGCPSCKKALSALGEDCRWVGLRKVAICMGYGPTPEAKGWELISNADASDVFDAELTPIYFIIDESGTVETGYTLAI